MAEPSAAPADAATVISALEELIDPEKARFLPRFFRTGPGEYGEGDRFLGVTVPLQRWVARRFARLHWAAVADLLASPFHEARLTALLVLVQRFAKADKARRAAIVRFYLDQLNAVNNWDLVDLSAPRILGAWLLDQPPAARQVLHWLVDSGDLWRQRVAMLATLPLIKADQFAEALAIAEVLLHHEHDLIHKAVGWMLREVGKRDLDTELAFLDAHCATMPRTMLRYAIEKFPPDRRRRYLATRGGTRRRTSTAAGAAPRAATSREPPKSAG